MDGGRERRPLPALRSLLGLPSPTKGTQPEDEIDKLCLEGEGMLDNCPSIHCLPTTIWMARAHGGSRREGFVMSESQRCCLA